MIALAVPDSSPPSAPQNGRAGSHAEEVRAPGSTLMPSSAAVIARRRIFLLAAALGLLLVVMVRNAWISDDGLITFRTIDNFVNGEGLRFNIAERVQSYTHPLWLFLLTPVYFFTREAFYTPIFVSLVCSAAAVMLGVVRLARSPVHAVAGVVCLVSSKSFIDYTTSGLENPLSYLLLGVWLSLYLKPTAARGEGFRLGALVFVASLAFVNRMDSVLLMAPGLVAAFATTVRATPRARAWLPAVFVGALPALAWTAFSIFYYGIPVSNTAYAKLYTGIDPSLLRSQGLFYLGHAVRFDPVTPLVMVLAGVASFAGIRRGADRLVPLALGIVLQLIYVVAIGGDFMMGRFLAVPFLAGVIVLVSFDGPRGAVGFVAAACLALSISSPLSPLSSGADYENRDPQGILENRGISDERGFYYERRGLLSSTRSEGRLLPGAACREDAERVVVRTVCGELGYEAYTGCRELLLADRCALSDPLLARMPMIDTTQWRVGHYFRRVPRGYPQSLEAGENQIADPAIRALYDDIRLVTRAPLLAEGRAAAIARLNGFGAGAVVD